MGVSAWNAKAEPFFHALRAQASFSLSVMLSLRLWILPVHSLECERDHLIRGARVSASIPWLEMPQKNEDGDSIFRKLRSFARGIMASRDAPGAAPVGAH